ncbi:MAG: septal ring lytic transglycosylase RlpA family protein, partial [Deltaproteobacteria bacterium]|nr:septal ring lytic transglycosylase RlpA family protein [Deltaproteobacteria bacterium]
QKGIASWYGPTFHGKKTANGEIYNMHAMTAAHKTLPLGTVVSVHNLKNGRKIVVRINDRGPFVRGRIIDLSNAAAKKIGMIAQGTAPVEIKALETISKNGLATRPAPDLDKGDFTVQVGAFADRMRAMRVKAALEKKYGTVVVTTFVKDGTTFNRVRAGRFSSLAKATAAESRLVNIGFPGAFTVSVDN